MKSKKENLVEKVLIGTYHYLNISCYPLIYLPNEYLLNIDFGADLNLGIWSINVDKGGKNH